VIPLHSRLENGATVSDWLGTASVVAYGGIRHIENVRAGVYNHPEILDEIITKFDQAIEEIKTVQAHLAYTKARGEKL
jgi:hypothetical protein